MAKKKFPICVALHAVRCQSLASCHILNKVTQYCNKTLYSICTPAEIYLHLLFDTYHIFQATFFSNRSLNSDTINILALKVTNSPETKQDHVVGSGWITRNVKLMRGPRS